MKKYKFNLSGFTLVEILVVMAVLGILAVGLIAAVNPAAQFAKSRDAIRKTEIKQLNGALEAYRIANGAYPISPGGAWLNSNQPGWQTFLASELKNAPVDPSQDCGTPFYPWVDGYPCYVYSYYSLNGSTYDLVARLENKNDPERCELKNWPFYAAGGASWCGAYSKYVYAPPH